MARWAALLIDLAHILEDLDPSPHTPFIDPSPHTRSVGCDPRVSSLPPRASQVILFIDELHTVVGAGAAEGAVDASDLLKPQLARGELACVGATTTNEYRLIEKDVALARRFQPITVPEPSVAQSITILRGLKERYQVARPP